jgi:hypothetical protein
MTTTKNSKGATVEQRQRLMEFLDAKKSMVLNMDFDESLEDLVGWLQSDLECDFLYDEGDDDDDGDCSLSRIPILIFGDCLDKLDSKTPATMEQRAKIFKFLDLSKQVIALSHGALSYRDLIETIQALFVKELFSSDCETATDINSGRRTASEH